MSQKRGEDKGNLRITVLNFFFYTISGCLDFNRAQDDFFFFLEGGERREEGEFNFAQGRSGARNVEQTQQAGL